MIEMANLLYKSPADAGKLEQLDFRVRWMVDSLRVYSRCLGWSAITITDIDTPNVHSAGGPHYDKRAVDTRLAPLKLTELESWAEWINGFFDYGRGYRVALVGRTDPKGGHGDHLHLQVPRPMTLNGRVDLSRVVAPAPA